MGLTGKSGQHRVDVLYSLIWSYEQDWRFTLSWDCIPQQTSWHTHTLCTYLKSHTKTQVNIDIQTHILIRYNNWPPPTLPSINLFSFPPPSSSSSVSLHPTLVWVLSCLSVSFLLGALDFLSAFFLCSYITIMMVPSPLWCYSCYLTPHSV